LNSRSTAVVAMPTPRPDARPTTAGDRQSVIRAPHRGRATTARSSPPDQARAGRMRVRPAATVRPASATRTTWPP
jgi:hypothetical protein